MHCVITILSYTEILICKLIWTRIAVDLRRSQCDQTLNRDVPDLLWFFGEFDLTLLKTEQESVSLQVLSGPTSSRSAQDLLIFIREFKLIVFEFTSFYCIITRFYCYCIIIHIWARRILNHPQKFEFDNPLKLPLPLRMRPLPARKGVGGESRMDDSQMSLEIRIGQVHEVAP